MTLAIFVTLFVLMIVGGAVVVIQSDRKRRPGDTKLLQASSIGSESMIPVAISTTPGDAVKIAQASIGKMGGREITTEGDRVVAGWIGSALTNLPNQQEYQLFVSISIVSEGMMQLSCGARPRFASSLFGSTKAQELAQRLAAEVSRSA